MLLKLTRLLRSTCVPNNVHPTFELWLAHHSKEMQKHRNKKKKKTQDLKKKKLINDSITTEKEAANAEQDQNSTPSLVHEYLVVWWF